MRALAWASEDKALEEFHVLWDYDSKLQSSSLLYILRMYVRSFRIELLVRRAPKSNSNLDRIQNTSSFM